MNHILEILRSRVKSTPDKMVYTFLKDGLDIEKSYTYAELDLHSRAIAKVMGEHVIGKRALLIFPPGIEFLAAFFGALYAGAIPIPAPPPDKARLKRTLPRLHSIIKDAGAEFIITASTLSETMQENFGELAESKKCKWISVDEVDPDIGLDWNIINEVDVNEPAYLQYTSGSTSMPKGVMVTHKGIMANCEVITQVFGYDENSVGVVWQPYFHDSGLVDGLIMPIYHGIPCYVMSPLAFLKRPERWLGAITRFKGTHTQAPNFAYEHSVRRISDEAIKKLDLSSMVCFCSGGEPNRADTINNFIDKFSACGLKPEAFNCAFGLAEATLIVTAKTKFGPPQFIHIDHEAYKDDTIIEVPITDNRGITIPSCGIIIDDVDVVIADKETFEELPDGLVGEVWTGGDSIAGGYWQKPEISEETFRARLKNNPEKGPYLRTGDLGFIMRNNLYVTGRAKDLIIVAGVNHYPQDIEQTVHRADEQIRVDHCVAFSTEVEGEEQLVVVTEVNSAKVDWDELLKNLRRAISEVHEVDLYALHVIRRGSTFKTSSGKLQRRKSKQAYENDEFKTYFSWNKQQSNPSVPAAKQGRILQRDDLQNELKRVIAKEIGVSEDQLQADRPFAELGMTSRSAVIIVGLLETWLGYKELPTTLLWEYSSLTTLTEFLIKGEHPDQRTSDALITRQKKVEATEPIAIIGYACDFPGAPNIQAFWDVLVEGSSTITDVPKDRWNADDYFRSESGTPGYINNKRGGFIAGVDTFDAAFFGITPSEAEVMDPQQRLLLELAWHSFESAQIPPNSMAGTDCGVFVGISTHDYSEAQFNNRFELNPYTGTSNSSAIAANRISYWFDFNGPSIAVDTACSSSLVALHQAVSALRNGECSTALVGGVNLLLSPKMSVALSQAQMLSKDGECRTFDQDANGYVRSEGGAMVLIKPLSAAIRDKDEIRAVINGSAINQDGKSNGLTAPNTRSQQAVITRALQNSAVQPNQIQYVEAHGTGTPLGDPIEMSSLQKVLSHGRTADQLCYVGSVKSNIGHLEAAAGMAGLLKLTLSLYHKKIPGNANFKQLNDQIKIQDTPFRITSDLTDWDTDQRIGSVSSFGFGGTNAHVVLSSYLDHDSARSLANDNSTRPVQLVPFSAKTKSSLRGILMNTIELVSDSAQIDLSDLAYSFAVAKDTMSLRKAYLASNGKELSQKLEEGLKNNEVGPQPEDQLIPEKVVWMFTGQGAQYTGMAKQLYAQEPKFREELDRCNTYLKPYLGSDLLDLCWDENRSNELHSTEYTQVALFALQVSIANTLMYWGLKPDAVIGYSVGEYAAACIAGIFTVEEGLKILTERGRLVVKFAKNGSMVAIMADSETVQATIEKIAGVEIATFNGIAGQVLGGTDEALKQAISAFEIAGIECKTLQVSHAFHTDLMEPVCKPFQKVLDRISLKPSTIPVISNVYGTYNSHEMQKSQYWVDHLRTPVNFGASLDTLFNDGYTTFLEIGPKPVMSGMANRFVMAEQCEWLSTLQPKDDYAQSWYKSIGRLWELGAHIDWERYYEGFVTKKVQTPLYPFDKKRYWLESSTKSEVDSTSRRLRLIGQPINSPLISGTLFHSTIDTTSYPFYAEHQVFNEKVVPAAGHIAVLVESAMNIDEDKIAEFSDVLFPEPLVLHSTESKHLQLFIEESNNVSAPFSLITLDHTGSSSNHATGVYTPVQSADYLLGNAGLNGIQQLFKNKDSRDFYDEIWQSHIELGPSFRWVKEVWKADSQVLVKLTNRPISTRYSEHELFPGLLDAALQGITALVSMKEDEVTIPFRSNRIRYYGRGAVNTNVFWSQIIEKASDEESALADLIVWEEGANEEPRRVLEIEGFGVRKVKKEVLLKSRWQGYENDVYSLNWRHLDSAEMKDSTSPRKWAVIGETEGNDWSILEQCSLSKSSIQVLSNLDEISSLDLSQCGILYTGALSLTTGASDQEYARVIEQLLEINRRVEHIELPIVVALTNVFGVPTTKGMVDLIPEQRAIWAFMKVLHQESVSPKYYLMDVGANQAEVIDLDRIIESNYPEVVFRQEGVYIPELVQQSFSRDIQVPIQSEACYLVTGGLGDLGLKLTTWLAEKGAKSIIITGRRPVSDDILSQIEALGLVDCEIHYKMMDLASPSSCEELIQGLTEDSYPLKGVFHLAGVTQDRKSIDLEWQDVEVVMTPKIRGLEHLVQSLDMELLDLLVVYSSASSLLGTAGQANYAMANAYMDAYVEQLAAKGLPAYSINWGPWDRGLAANYTRVFKTQGIEAMIPELAMNTLSLVLSQSTSRQVLIMKANWTTYTQVNGVQEQLKQLITNENSEESTPTSSNFSQKVANLGVEERYVELEKLIKIEIGQLLHIKNMSTISNRKRLFEIGLDSLDAVDLKNKLASSLGTELRGTLLFDFPTIEDLVQHIGHDVFKWQESQEPGDSEKSRDILSDDLSEDDLAALLMKELGDE